MTDPRSAPLVITLNSAPRAPDVAAALRDGLAPALAAFLPRQRWYGDKSRPLVAVSVVDAAADEHGPPWFVLAIVEATFADGSPPARYLIPLATVPVAAAPDPVAILMTPSESLAFVDAIEAPGFPLRLLRRLAENARLDGGGGAFHWEAFPALAPLVSRAEAAPPRLIGVEYSNSSLRFGDILFLKLVRRLRAGLNPDEEIGRHLAEQSSFANFPIPLGAGRYRAADGTTYPFALAQAFVHSTGDGWDVTLARLAAPLPADSTLTETAPEALLGRRTAELHLALAADTADPAFAPEPVKRQDVDHWREAARAHLQAVANDLDRYRTGAVPAVRHQIARFHDHLPALERRADGFSSLIGTVRCRVHGDFHLGQLLKTPDDDWIILDFEGEPARSLSERRAKTSVLKDVSGMLRSFSYARSEAARRAALAPGGATIAVNTLDRWEAGARTAFLAAYRARIGEERRAVNLIPADLDHFSAATAAWEFDKAIYELAYEINNRPDWLPHALGTILRDGDALA